MTHATTSEFVLYGIKNCDTVRKARRFLDEHGASTQYHDFRQDGLDEAMVDRFIDQLGIKALLNTRGTTWRNLPEETRQQADQPTQARKIMLEHPAVIKRPILVRTGGEMIIGFDATRWENFLQGDK